MYIEKIFSEVESDERLYSVLMSEEEYNLFSEFLKEFASIRGTKKQILKLADKAIEAKKQANQAWKKTGSTPAANIAYKKAVGAYDKASRKLYQPEFDIVDKVYDRKLAGRFVSKGLKTAKKKIIATTKKEGDRVWRAQ